MSQKLISWNVNGIRAAIKKGFHDSLSELDPDIICLQETKAQDDQVIEALGEIPYHVYVNSAIKKGYSGTAILTKEKAISVSKGIGIEEHDQEGRVLTVEFEKYYFVGVYVPNSSQGLKRLPYRETWDVAFKNYLKNLEEKKPVIVCGDFNVAHQEIDIARPKSNYNKTAGYTQKEIDGMTNFLEAGFIDTFRKLYPEEVAYSWWSYRAGAREKNIGWRLDYFLVSEVFMDQVQDSTILPDYMESDHCPICLQIS
ncbi:exodeoxyribonuclease III [Reichenbachiella versicolor]|uniref:exodeoxyribonuclease III n=1 Tax=Reichenbachiella versicolor TaxID=1821036 RepID=UPI000D6E19EE|nr:exodeoxyribonuclease III [Reichenbachiella versicolor]